MPNVHSLIDSVNNKVELMIADMFDVSAEELGLDSRAGYRLYVNADCIIASKDEARKLDYYAGFEYVDNDYKVSMGDYVIYLADDERVAGAIVNYMAEQEEE